MPELPEVETIRRDLTYLILGKGIRDVEFYTGRCVLSDSEEMKNTLCGNRFEGIRRKGKLLIFELAFSDKRLLMHLKMTGQVICEVPGGIVVGGHPSAKIDHLPNNYTHVRITLADGTNMYFNDVRTFGWLKLVDDREYQAYLQRYGIDPVAEPFTWDLFSSLLENKKGEIKAFLLNQKYIAGIGNIYADEILHRAKILPGRSLATLSESETKRLFRAIKSILDVAVRKRGTTFSNFVDASGQKGGFHKHLRVYGREGERCYRCGDDFIEKKVLAGRGTHYCSSCQK